MSKKMSVSEKIVSEILDKGLRSSTWAETYPSQYKSLLDYREDLEASVRHILIQNHKQLSKAFGDI